METSRSPLSRFGQHGSGDRALADSRLRPRYRGGPLLPSGERPWRQACLQLVAQGRRLLLSPTSSVAAVRFRRREERCRVRSGLRWLLAVSLGVLLLASAAAAAGPTISEYG